MGGAVSREKQKPTITTGLDRDADRYEHPAFGTIVLVESGGGDPVMFGSDLGHNNKLSIRIHRAELDRHLNQDWIHSRGQLLELEMSHAQFAEFITSVGKGRGVPCTLRWIKGEGDIPGIDKLESKHDMHRREILRSAGESIEKMRESLEGIRRMVDDGRCGKKELKEILFGLKCHLDNLPSNLEFSVKQAERAFEKASSDARIEIESFIALSAQRLGLKHINELLTLEDKANGQAD